MHKYQILLCGVVVFFPPLPGCFFIVRCLHCRGGQNIDLHVWGIFFFFLFLGQPSQAFCLLEQPEKEKNQLTWKTVFYLSICKNKNALHSDALRCCNYSVHCWFSVSLSAAFTRLKKEEHTDVQNMQKILIKIKMQSHHITRMRGHFMVKHIETLATLK